VQKCCARQVLVAVALADCETRNRPSPPGASTVTALQASGNQGRSAAPAKVPTPAVDNWTRMKDCAAQADRVAKRNELDTNQSVLEVA